MPFDGLVGAIKAEPALHGLLSAAIDVVEHEGSDDHWGSEVRVEAETCNVTISLWGSCGTTPEGTSVIDTSSDSRWFDVYPNAITATDRCSTLGYSVEERKARIKHKLELGTGKAIEYELWTGAGAIDAGHEPRYLNSDTAVSVNGSTAVKPMVGLALLERALGDCGVGARGTIHATRDVATMLANGIEDGPQGTRLHTWLGTPIAAGTGYDGTGPGGADPGSGKAWMYATGPVVVHVGAINFYAEEPAEVVDVAVNDVILQADRLATAYWDGCCHYAVLVDLSA